MSPEGRFDAAARWAGGDFGPAAEMARAASAHCGTCGFYLALAGSLRGAFGVCGNGNVPADGHVVHAEHGCGGHSELQVDTGSVVMVSELVYDDGVDMEPEPSRVDRRARTAPDASGADTPSGARPSHPIRSAPPPSAPPSSTPGRPRPRASGRTRTPRRT